MIASFFSVCLFLPHFSNAIYAQESSMHFSTGLNPVKNVNFDSIHNVQQSRIIILPDQDITSSSPISHNTKNNPEDIIISYEHAIRKINIQLQEAQKQKINLENKLNETKGLIEQNEEQSHELCIMTLQIINLNKTLAMDLEINNYISSYSNHLITNDTNNILHQCEQKQFENEQNAHDVFLKIKSLEFYKSQYSTNRRQDNERLSQRHANALKEQSGNLTQLQQCQDQSNRFLEEMKDTNKSIAVFENETERQICNLTYVKEDIEFKMYLFYRKHLGYKVDHVTRKYARKKHQLCFWYFSLYRNLYMNYYASNKRKWDLWKRKQTHTTWNTIYRYQNSYNRCRRNIYFKKNQMLFSLYRNHKIQSMKRSYSTLMQHTKIERNWNFRDVKSFIFEGYNKLTHLTLSDLSNNYSSIRLRCFQGLKNMRVPSSMQDARNFYQSIINYIDRWGKDYIINELLKSKEVAITKLQTLKHFLMIYGGDRVSNMIYQTHFSVFKKSLIGLLLDYVNNGVTLKVLMVCLTISSFIRWMLLEYIVVK